MYVFLPLPAWASTHGDARKENPFPAHGRLTARIEIDAHTKIHTPEFT